MFLRNAWYAAAWGHEVEGTPLARTVLNRPLVLYRDRSNRAVVLDDRCCHRGLPLSRGRVIDDGIECGYHGLVFDRSGRCVRVPGQTKVPPGRIGCLLAGTGEVPVDMGLDGGPGAGG